MMMIMTIVRVDDWWRLSGGVLGDQDEESDVGEAEDDDGGGTPGDIV